MLLRERPDFGNRVHHALRKPRGGTDQQKQQAMMMNFMSVFFTFLFYNMPAGLNLYIGASNIFGMLESWRIRKHVRQEQDQIQVVKPAPAQPSTADTGRGRSRGASRPYAQRRRTRLAFSRELSSRN